MSGPPHDEFRRLEPAAVTVWRAGALVSVGVPLLVSALGLGLSSVLLNVPRRVVLFALAIGAPVALALVVLALVWPGLRYRHTSYRVSERGLRIRRGVIVRVESSVPRTRVQHTDVTRGPIERAFGLATLVVYTAGTEYSSVSLGGLTVETANGVRDFLLAHGRGGDDRDDDDAV